MSLSSYSSGVFIFILNNSIFLANTFKYSSIAPLVYCFDSFKPDITLLYKKEVLSDILSSSSKKEGFFPKGGRLYSGLSYIHLKSFSKLSV